MVLEQTPGIAIPDHPAPDIERRLVATAAGETGGQADNAVATYAAVTTPALDSLAGQAKAGRWRLRVADQERADTGKLRRWRLTLKQAQTSDQSLSRVTAARFRTSAFPPPSAWHPL